MLATKGAALALLQCHQSVGGRGDGELLGGGLPFPESCCGSVNRKGLGLSHHHAEFPQNKPDIKLGPRRCLCLFFWKQGVELLAFKAVQTGLKVSRKREEISLAVGKGSTL